MKHIVITTVLFLFCMTGWAQTQNEVLEQYFGLGLPLVCITTMDGEEPTSENIDHPEGHYIGASITNIMPKEARMQIYRADTLWYDSGDFVNDESGIKIRHRGNTSAYHFENKPFKLKLQKKADLIDTHEEGDQTDRRSKDWVLLNEVGNIDYLVAYKLSRFIGMEYTPRMQYVNVIINNDYRGLYILMENVSRDKECRINVDKDEGYIIELNAYFWNEEFSIESTMTRYLQWTLKYPKPEDRTEEQEENIRTDIARLEASVKGYDYPEVIDVRSFALWILVHDIMGTRDSGGCNVYVARTDRDPSSRMRMPVVWDFSGSMVAPEKWSATHEEKGIFFYRLFANELCLDFTTAYIQEWKRTLEEQVLEKLIAFLDEYPTTPEAMGLKRSAPLHKARWNHSYNVANLDRKVANAKQWMNDRRLWIGENISLMESYVTPVSSVLEGKTSHHAKELLPNGQLIIRHDGETYTIDGVKIE